jgi:uncharacterized membrane protein YraQ (UPF0718 family)
LNRKEEEQLNINNANKMIGSPALRFFLLLTLLLCCYPSLAHESCCKHKLQQFPASEFIDDPNDTAPAEFQGQPRYLIDTEDVRPDDWDDDEDGLWEPNVILNRNYEWKPRQIANPNYQAPPTFWDKLWGEVQMAVPWATLGILITGMATCSLSLPPYRSFLDWWKNSFQETNGGSILLAAVLGLATPLCSCGALPVAAGFWNEGIPPKAVVAFLTASQSAGIDSAAITYGLLGPVAVFSRLIGAMILAVVAGNCLPLQSSKNRPDKKIQNASSLTKSGQSSLQLLLVTLADTAYDVLPSVLLGLTLSTAVVHYLPSTLHPTISERPNPLSALLIRWSILASALPLQLCEHTTVALAAAIQKAGGSPGLAFGFLLSAPATNLPTLLLLTKKMMAEEKQQSTSMILMIRMALAVSGTALIFSYLVDYLEMDLLVQEEAKTSTGMASFPDLYTTTSPWLAGVLFLAGVVRATVLSTKKALPPSTVVGKVEEESCCNSCPAMSNDEGGRNGSDKKDD